MLPLVLPPVVGGIALLYTFGRQGLLGKSLELAGIQIAFSTTAVVLAQTYVALPFLVVSLEGALRTAGNKYEAVAATLRQFGRLDIVVNAVGGGAGKVIFSAEDYPRDAWDWIMELNLRSTLVATQAAVRPMIAAGRGGRILNISSVRAQLGIAAGYSAYVAPHVGMNALAIAAKGAVSSLTRQWATEWAKHGITVNAIAPTFVDTPQVAMLLGDPDFKADVVSRVPLGRVGETGDLIGPAIFFTCDASAFVTGQVLTIDGGLTATQ